MLAIEWISVNEATQILESSKFFVYQLISKGVVRSDRVTRGHKRSYHIVSRSDIEDVKRKKYGGFTTQEFIDALSDSNSIYGYLYLLKNNSEFKIGITGEHKPKRRLQRIRNKERIDFDVVLAFELYNYAEIETMLHKKFSDKRLHGEWFALDQQDIDFIKWLQKEAQTAQKST